MNEIVEHILLSRNNQATKGILGVLQNCESFEYWSTLVQNNNWGRCTECPLKSWWFSYHQVIDGWQRWIIWMHLWRSFNMGWKCISLHLDGINLKMRVFSFYNVMPLCKGQKLSRGNSGQVKLEVLLEVYKYMIKVKELFEPHIYIPCNWNRAW